MYLIIFIEIDIVFEDYMFRNIIIFVMVRNFELLFIVNWVGEN